jgi:hypothetical protein
VLSKVIPATVFSCKGNQTNGRFVGSVIQLIVACKYERLANEKERAETECPAGSSACGHTGDRRSATPRTKEDIPKMLA